MDETREAKMLASRLETVKGRQVDYQCDRLANLVERLESEIDMLAEALSDVSRPRHPSDGVTTLEEAEPMRSPLAGRTAAMNDRLQVGLDRLADLREYLDFSNR